VQTRNWAKERAIGWIATKARTSVVWLVITVKIWYCSFTIRMRLAEVQGIKRELAEVLKFGETGWEVSGG
jgi:hypothetical protein